MTPTNARTTSLTALSVLLLLPATASAVTLCTAPPDPEPLGPLPPPICEPVSITIDIPPGMNTHEECLPPLSPQPSSPPRPSESIEAPDES